MKKILFVVEAMGGGVFTYIVELANELVNFYDIYIAYATRTQTPENYKDYFDKRIHLIKVESFVRSIDCKNDFKAFFEIKKIANEIQPDIIHLHSSKAGALGRIAFGSRKVPVFYTPHGYSFLMEDTSPIKRKIYRAIERLCGKTGCTVISCSEGEHKETLSLTSKAVYVNNGINIKKLENLIKQCDIENGHDFTVFTLGRICYQKNPELFNKIATALPNIKFVWIGDGDMKDKLTSPNIEVTGWVNRQDALRYALNANAFILTSLWEGLPISLLEAMYMKKICIVSNVIGNRDVIHSGVNGFVCDNIGDYITAIEESRKEKCNQYIEKAYSDILNIYNTKKMSESYRLIYEQEIREK